MRTRDPHHGKQRNGYSVKQQIPIHEQTSSVPYDIDDQVGISHQQYHNESAQHYTSFHPYIQQNESYHNFYTPRQPQRKVPRHQRSYNATLEESLHQQMVLNIEHIIFQNTQIIENLTNDNQRLQAHLENIKQLFEIKSLKNPQPSSLQPPIKSESQNGSKHQGGRLPTKRQYSVPANVKTTQEIRSELKKKIKTEKITANKGINQVEFTKQEETNPFKGSINYTTENWAIEQNYVMRFLKLWLKDNVQKINDESLAIDKKIIMGCYENWRNLQKFEIQSHLKTAQVQQVLTIEVKAFFKCSCNAKGFVGLEFTKEEFKHFGGAQKQEESEAESLELESERQNKVQ